MLVSSGDALRRSHPIRRARHILVMALVLAAPMGKSAAAAESTLVVVAERKPAESNADAVANRLRGELAADGIDVALVELPISAAEADLLEQEVRNAGAEVGAALVVGSDGRTVELMLVDASTGRVVRRQVDSDAGPERSGPEVLARRSVDLLRASLLDFVVESLRAAVSRSQPTAPAAAPPPHGLRANLGGGFGVLGGFQGVGPAVVPVIRAAVTGSAPDAHWQLRATAAALGTHPTVITAAGSATIDQSIAVIETVVSPWAAHSIRPIASAGLGVYYVSVSGMGIPPDTGTQSSSFALALAAGVGVIARVASALDVAIEVQALVTAPGLAVRFVDDDAAHVGRPSVLGTLTVAGWL
jgi:hypothetical protein